MELELRGFGLGEYPPLVIGDRIIYKTPVEYLEKSSNQLITLGKGTGKDQFVLTFYSWYRDRRFKNPIKGTWYQKEFCLNKKQIHALQRMEWRGEAGQG